MEPKQATNFVLIFAALDDKEKSYCCYEVIGSNTEIVHCLSFSCSRKKNY